ncbi:MAG: type I methionyl aminopeptidase [Candidatus Bipolaricaulota bacterium]|nr:type I methionyl aminopeptidase [Candidatus Bipolaricaulota bacterium]
MIALKTAPQIAVMRENGALLASVLQGLCNEASPGQSTGELDRMAEELIRKAGAEPAFKGYQGFPGTICSSINREVVHGIPSFDRRLDEGDILSIDIGLHRNGMYMDMATTVPIGEVNAIARRLIEVTEEALWRGIEQVKIGRRVSDISHAIGAYVEAAGMYVVQQYVGHGIGKQLHEDPQIPNYGSPGQGARLREGMVFAIEPMVKLDPELVEVLDDGWTVVTANGGLAAHFEHTVVITDTGVEILSLGGEKRRSG